MQVSRSHRFEGARYHYLIGRIKACAVWSAVGAAGTGLRTLDGGVAD